MISITVSAASAPTMKAPARIAPRSRVPAMMKPRQTPGSAAWLSVSPMRLWRRSTAKQPRTPLTRPRIAAPSATVCTMLLCRRSTRLVMILSDAASKRAARRPFRKVFQRFRRSISSLQSVRPPQRRWQAAAAAGYRPDQERRPADTTGKPGSLRDIPFPRPVRQSFRQWRRRAAEGLRDQHGVFVDHADIGPTDGSPLTHRIGIERAADLDSSTTRTHLLNQRLDRARRDGGLD